jgi:hypothetical protein
VHQFHGGALVFGQAGQGVGQAQQFLLPDGRLAGGGVIGRQPLLQAAGGLVQRPLQVEVAPLAGEAADRAGQGVEEDLPQPGRPLSFGAAAELVLRLVRLEQRLLDDVGGVQLGLHLRPQLHPGQQVQVLPIALQGSTRLLGFAGHDLSFSGTDRPQKSGAPGRSFPGGHVRPLPRHLTRHWRQRPEARKKSRK